MKGRFYVKIRILKVNIRKYLYCFRQRICTFTENFGKGCHIMKKTAIFISVVIIFQLFSGTVWAQHSSRTHVHMELKIPPIALINAATLNSQIISYGYSYSSNKVNQVITKSHMAQTWLNYSSVVRPGSSNFITANISSGVLPSDVTLKVAVSSDSASGVGALGTPVGVITLTNYPQNLIINIGSCYTGVGLNKGRLIEYIWDNPQSYDYYLRYQNGTPISVTYTITSN